MKYDSTKDTKIHIYLVSEALLSVAEEFAHRSQIHDLSKLQSPEKELFDVYTPKLAGCTYGSEEYKQFLLELKPALDHHYANNSHHPEYFKNGIRGMNLFDLVEMFFDWWAATKRHNDGDIMKSIEINEKRFSIPPELSDIFRNTVAYMPNRIVTAQVSDTTEDHSSNADGNIKIDWERIEEEAKKKFYWNYNSEWINWLKTNLPKYIK